MRANDAGRNVDVVFACSYRAPATVTPEIEKEFNRTFQLLRSLPCDVPLGDHPAQYSMTDKYARLQSGAPNPFVDPAGCGLEAEIQEAMLRAQLQWQQKAGPPPAAIGTPSRWSFHESGRTDEGWRGVPAGARFRASASDRSGHGGPRLRLARAGRLQLGARLLRRDRRRQRPARPAHRRRGRQRARPSRLRRCRGGRTRSRTSCAGAACDAATACC